MDAGPITVVVAVSVAVPVTRSAYTAAAAATSRGADPSGHVRQIVASFRFPARPRRNPDCDRPDSCLQGSVRGESGAGALVPH